MNKDFNIELIGDVDLNGMAIEISYQGQTLAELNYEKGAENAEIKLEPNFENQGKWIFPLEKFLNALIKAKNILEQCAREDQERS